MNPCPDLSFDCPTVAGSATFPRGRALPRMELLKSNKLRIYGRFVMGQSPYIHVSIMMQKILSGSEFEFVHDFVQFFFL